MSSDRPYVSPSEFAGTVLGFTLYPVQAEVCDAVAEEGSRVSYMAANDAGKTARVITTLILWHLWQFPKGKVKSTSGSWIQIIDQLTPSLARHKNNPLFEGEYEFMTTPQIRNGEFGGFWRGFSTKEPGRAEGDHSDGPECPLLFIVDEAKTVPDPIFRAISRCVDLDKHTRLLYGSSPGFAEGEFFRSQQKTKGNKFKIFRQTAYDTPHISAEQIQTVKDRWAGFEAFANSMLGIDFMPLIDDAIIDGKALDFCLGNPKVWKPGEIHAFCDFAWSNDGDENVLAVCNGNRITLEKCFHADNLKDICDTFEREIKRLGLKPGQVSADEGGGGKLICDEFDDRGFPLNRVNNGSPANDSDHYVSLAAEMWYESSKAISSNEVILPLDNELRGQMLSRKRIKGSKGRLAIESKKDMKKRGIPSPDRCDACFGAWAPVHGFAPAGGGDMYATPLKVGNYEAFGG